MQPRNLTVRLAEDLRAMWEARGMHCSDEAIAKYAPKTDREAISGLWASAIAWHTAKEAEVFSVEEPEVLASLQVTADMIQGLRLPYGAISMETSSVCGPTIILAAETRNPSGDEVHGIIVTASAYTESLKLPGGHAHLLSPIICQMEYDHLWHYDSDRSVEVHYHRTDAYEGLKEGLPEIDDLVEITKAGVPLIVHMLAVINARGFDAEVVTPAPSLNRKRAKRGRPPLRPTTIVDLGGSRRSARAGTGGTVQDRRGPRLHTRRGHLRHMASGVVTWVRPALVGAGERVQHSYRVRQP